MTFATVLTGIAAELALFSAVGFLLFAVNDLLVDAIYFARRFCQPMPLDFRLDAYVQAGIVGFKSRDLFADGAFAFTRPVYDRFSAGLGVWGGIQPGLYRVDAGPRISFRLRDNIHAHLDWRQRLIGNAQPASGPSLTLAADF